MKYLLKIWDFLLLFFAFSTTKHCNKLKWDDQDPALRGPDNPKTKNTYYRANKVSKS